MELVADIDRERSLAAMWCPYLATNSVAENHAENRTSVGCFEDGFFAFKKVLNLKWIK
jgi:hypothetical protein